MQFSTFIRQADKAVRDDRGAGIIELALGLPIMLVLLVGMIDASRFIAARIDLEQAAQRTTDYALAKRPDNSDDATYLRTEAASAAGVPTGNVTAEIFLECNGVRQTNFDTICATGETTARFINISITRQVNTLFDWQAAAHLFGSQVFGSSITVTGNSLVRFQ